MEDVRLRELTKALDIESDRAGSDIISPGP
jgi:hypothetical protein